VRYFSEHNEDGESQVNCIGEKTGKDSLFGLARLFGRLTEGPTVPLPALSEVGRERCNLQGLDPASSALPNLGG